MQMTLPLRRYRVLGMSLVMGGAALLTGCSTTPPVDSAARQALAPTGTLRIGVYAGSPLSMVRDATTGEPVGIALGLGQQLALRLGVPARVVEFERQAQVIEAVQNGDVDFTVTSSSTSVGVSGSAPIREPAPARDANLSLPIFKLALGTLVSKDSSITELSDMDRGDLRIGVSQGSSSQAALTRVLQNATPLPVATLKQAQVLLRRGTINAFAADKATLFEMLDALPGFRMLDGRWGSEQLVIVTTRGREVGLALGREAGLALGREAGLAYLRQFAESAQKPGGLLQSLASRVELRGTLPLP